MDAPNNAVLSLTCGAVGVRHAVLLAAVAAGKLRMGDAPRCLPCRQRPAGSGLGPNRDPDAAAASSSSVGGGTDVGSSGGSSGGGGGTAVGAGAARPGSLGLPFHVAAREELAAWLVGLNASEAAEAMAYEARRREGVSGQPASWPAWTQGGGIGDKELKKMREAMRWVGGNLWWGRQPAF